MIFIGGLAVIFAIISLASFYLGYPIIDWPVSIGILTVGGCVFIGSLFSLWSLKKDEELFKKWFVN